MSTKCFAIVLLSLAPVLLNAQLVDEFNPPKGTCCLASAAANLATQLLDYNELGRYHADNEKLRTQAAEPGRVVFMGDSITDGWKLSQYFPNKPYVNRGISGQTTPQMLARMFEDVINLKPEAMIVLGGTNDIARNTGPVTLSMIEENIQMITELAHAHGIKVILCSVTPTSDYGPRKMTDGRPPSDILKLNAWMKEYTARNHETYCDYFNALVDEKGWLKEGISRDGLHPNEKGYDLMVPVAATAIQTALGQR